MSRAVIPSCEQNEEQIANRIRQNRVKYRETNAIRIMVRQRRGSAHNPKVVSSNLAPATMAAYEANPLSAFII